jgi:hypothetical protein
VRPSRRLPVAPLDGDARWDYRLSHTGENPILVDVVTTKKYMPSGEWGQVFNGALEALVVRLPRKATAEGRFDGP